MEPHDIALFVYNIALLPVVFFSILFIMLALLNLFIDKKKENKLAELKELPFITVQIPAYNDPVAERCIRHCMEFNYPKDKYELIIADDSSNTETQSMLARFEEQNPGFVKYVHREHRKGFKAGALKNSMKHARGELIVIFDADWMPGRDFLSNVIKPFSDPKVAIVQTRQGFYNKDSNIITRFAAYILMIYHTIIMPVSNKANCVFFCGTAGAIRRSIFEKVGGWNLNSLTEDSDLTVRMLLNGYKTVYLDFATPSEVPSTFESFIKQQMRWCYGNARVFFDNALKILFKKGIPLRQRATILFVTLGNIASPFVFIMTIAGFSGWFLGEPELFGFKDIVDMAIRILMTAGFMIMGIIALHRNKALKEFPYLVLASLTMGLVLAVANSIAFFRAAFNKQLSWFCTAKDGNNKFA